MDDTFANWFVGFTDGEGSFQVLINTNKSSRHGFFVEVRFSIGLHSRDAETLKKINEQMKVGEIVARNLKHSRLRGIGSQDQVHYIVRGYADCCVIRDFFRKNPLQTTKRRNFDLWSQVLAIIGLKQHRGIKGILEISKLRDQMEVKTRNYRYRSYEWFKSHFGLGELKC